MIKLHPWCKHICLPVLFLLSIHLLAQDTHLTNPDPQQTAFVDFSDSKGSYFFTGEKVNASRNNADVTNFYKPNWMPGVVQLVNGQQFGVVQLKFNLASNEVFFNKNGNLISFTEPVAGFTLLDSANGRVTVARFNNGYPAYGKQNNQTFYQVLAYGKKVHLLKHFTKYVSEKQGYNTTTTFKSKILADYYLYDLSSHELKLIKSSTASIQKALPQFEKQLSVFAGFKKLSEADMVDMVNSLNAL